MAREKAILIDVDYKVLEGKLSVRLLLKGEKGLFRLHDRYEPYFYLDAPEEKMEEIKKTEVDGEGGKVGVTRVEPAELVLKGEKKKLLKVFCAYPFHVPVLRGELRGWGAYEYRIPFARRYLIDKGLAPFSLLTYEREGRDLKEILKSEEGAFDLKAIAFDIETYNPLGSPRPEKDPAIMISYANGKKGVLTYREVKRGFATALKGEKEIIDAFCRMVKDDGIELLIGYNSAAFDLPYLKKRADVLKTTLPLGRDGSSFTERRKGLMRIAKVTGRVHIDLYPAVRFLGTIGAFKVSRYTLETAYNEITGKKKMMVPKLGIWEMWDSDEKRNELADYSLHDAEVTKELADIILPIEVEMSRITKTPLFDVCNATAGQLVESLLMRASFERGEVIPNIPGESDVRERMARMIKGAFVKLPTPGIYENLVVFDFRSLYPSIITSHNVDPYTLNRGRKEDGLVSPYGTWFSKEPRGIIPSVLEDLIGKRSEIKKRLKKLKKDSEEYKRLFARSQSLKILANSVAGDERVLIRSPRGDVRLRRISDFVDPLVDKKKMVGNTQIGDANGWEAVCFINSKVVFSPIKKVMRHRNSEPLLRIVLKSGRSVKVTKGHSVFKLGKNGMPSTVPSSALRTGDGILVPKNISFVENKKKTINLVRELSDCPNSELRDIIITNKFSTPLDVLRTRLAILYQLRTRKTCAYKLADILGVLRKTIIRNLRSLKSDGFVKLSGEYSTLSCSITKKGIAFRTFLHLTLDKWEYNGNKREHYLPFLSIKDHVLEIDDAFIDGWKIGALNGFRLSPFLNVNSDLMRFLGYYISEGYSRKWLNWTGGYSYRVGLTNYNKAVLRDMVRVSASVGFKPSVYRHAITLNQKMAYLTLRHVLKAGSVAKEKRVPPIIFNCSRRLKSEFLKTYFTGDGNYERHAKRHRFTTVSRRLADDLVILLNMLGIGAVGVKRDGKFYRVVVNEPLFGSKRQLFRYYSFTVPGKLIEEEVAALGRHGFFYRNCAKNGRIGRGRLEKFRKLYSSMKGRSKKLENLLSFLKGDLAVDEVAEIKTMDNKEGFVYDLSVDRAENFLGGFGLICLHNSFYGYLAYARSRWYSRDCGESVTAWGREYVQKTIKKAEEEGFNALYADSITDDRFVTVLDAEGVVEIKNIKELFDENKRELRKYGGKDRIMLKGYKALTVDPTTKKVIWAPINEVIRHKVNKKVYRVNQKYGETKVTKDHSLMTETGGKLCEMKPDDIYNTPMYKLESVPKTKRITKLDMYKLLKAYAYTTPYKGCVKNAILHADDRFVWFGWTNRKKSVKLRRYIRVGGREFEALCKLLGAYVAGGSASTPETTSSRMGAGIATGDMEWLEELRKCYLLLFKNAKACIIPSQKKMRTLTYRNSSGEKMIVYKDNTLKLQMMNGLSAVFFKMLCGQKSSGKKLPEFIFHSPKKYKWLLLDNILQGDGSRIFQSAYSEEYAKNNFKLTTRSLQLLGGLSFLLTQMGQKYTVQYRPSKKVYTVQTCSRYNRNLTTVIREETYSGYVYDLSVEGSHMFVDSCGQILLHNTDSVFLVLRDKTREDALSFMKKINDELPEKMELELEGFYPRGVFVTKKAEAKGAKKKYALIGEDGKIKIRGFELVRRDWAKIAKDTQMAVLKAILEEGSREKAVKVVRDAIERIKKGEVDMGDMVMYTQLRKDPKKYEVMSPELSAARKGIKRGVAFEKGSVVGYVITKRGTSISDKAETVEYAKDYDPAYYIDHQVLPSVMKILKELGYSEDDLKFKGTQKNLSSFFE